MTNRRIRLKPTCHCEERSDVAIRHPLRRTKTYCYLEKKRIPTTSDIGHWFRNDSGFLYSALSFPKWHFLHPSDPSVACATAPLVGAPRARRIDMPPLPQIPHFFQRPIDMVGIKSYNPYLRGRYYEQGGMTYDDLNERTLRLACHAGYGRARRRRMASPE